METGFGDPPIDSEARLRVSHYVLHLYISGQTPRSLRAVSNLQRICVRYLGGNCELVQIDVLERPDLAEAAHILATPVTIRMAPPPMYRVIGDLGDPVAVLAALGIDGLQADAQPSSGET